MDRLSIRRASFVLAVRVAVGFIVKCLFVGWATLFCPPIYPYMVGRKALPTLPYMGDGFNPPRQVMTKNVIGCLVLWVA